MAGGVVYLCACLGEVWATLLGPSTSATRCAHSTHHCWEVWAAWRRPFEAQGKQECLSYWGELALSRSRDAAEARRVRDLAGEKSKAGPSASGRAIAHPEGRDDRISRLIADPGQVRKGSELVLGYFRPSLRDLLQQSVTTRPVSFGRGGNRGRRACRGSPIFGRR